MRHALTVMFPRTIAPEMQPGKRNPGMDRDGPA